MFIVRYGFSDGLWFFILVDDAVSRSWGLLFGEADVPATFCPSVYESSSFRG